MTAPRRANDPDRRERILEATLDMLAEHGLSHITHRKIAQAANVPLGSMTYYFTGIHALVSEAFELFAQRLSVFFRQSMQEAKDSHDACEVIADLICQETLATPYNIKIMYQLYAAAHSYPQLKGVMQRWMGQSQQTLGLFFEADTAKALDAYIEGMSLHYITDVTPLSRDVQRQVIRRIAGL